MDGEPDEWEATMSAQPSHNPTAAKLIEKQVRNWELARAQRGTRVAKRDQEVEDFVAISRMVGSGGTDVAKALGATLGWPVFDKEILQAMAGDDDIRRQLYGAMDERDLSWFEETLRGLLTSESKPNDYFTRLTQAILSIARNGHAVFLGRAANLILPATAGLRVRIVASPERRLRRFAERNDLTLEEARTQMTAIERDRTRFIANHFGVDSADPTRHDLVLNLDRWSVAAAVDVIQAARTRRHAPGNRPE